VPSNYVGGHTNGARQAHFLNINVAAADTDLFAATTGIKYVVHGLCITGDAAGIVSFVSDGSSDTEIASFRLTALSAAGWLGPILLPVSDSGWFETLGGEALDLRLATTANADGVIVVSKVASTTP
jgi:hypothetical protein